MMSILSRAARQGLCIARNARYHELRSFVLWSRVAHTHSEPVIREQRRRDRVARWGVDRLPPAPASDDGELRWNATTAGTGAVNDRSRPGLEGGSHLKRSLGMERLWRLITYKGIIPQGTCLRVAKRMPALPGGLRFIKPCVSTKRWAIARRWRCGAKSWLMGERPRQLWT